MDVLPGFRYHPDPLTSGSVVAGDDECEVCGRARGFLYVGPVYSAIADEPVVCPWCIADGSAASALEADFTDVGCGAPADVPPDVLEELAHRTPGFTAWQQEHWLFHCGDAAAFVGPVGWPDLEDRPEARECLRREHDDLGWDAGQVEAYLTALSRTGSPTAYLFRCRRCGEHLAHSDSD